MKRIYLPLTIILCLGIVSTGMAQSNTIYGTNAGNGGTYNSHFGYNAGRVSTGSYNVFMGRSAGRYNTSGDDNVFMGYVSGYTNTTGSNNVFVGYYSGYKNTTGQKNTFIGRSTGYSNTSGYDNTFLGRKAGVDNTTGHSNTFIGEDAGYKNTTGNSNVYIGKNAGVYNKASNNTIVGLAAGYNSTGSSNVFLGYYAGYNETGSNKLYIDNSSTASPLIYGDFSANIVNINGKLGVGTNTPDEKLTVKGKIHAEGLVCDLNIPAPDYVFEPDYRLRTLAEVEAYIQKHKHLPSVPSAKTMAKEGVQLLALSMKLLEKVEELTLYTLAQQKEIAQLKKQVKQLQQK